MNEKKNGPCGTFLWVWVIATVAFIVIFNSINETGQSMGEIIFQSIVIGGMIGAAAFSVRMFLITSGIKKIQQAPYVNPYVNTTLFDTGNDFPVVNYPNLFLKPGEKIIYAAPAQTYTEHEQVVGYSGASVGASVRVAKGLSIRKGGSRGTPIRQNVKKFNGGDYVVTNLRIVFVSQSDGFEYDVRKISVVKPISQDTFIIMCGSKQKNICVDASQTKYALGMTTFVVQQGQKI